jgi:hypothetical protein
MLANGSENLGGNDSGSLVCGVPWREALTRSIETIFSAPTVAVLNRIPPPRLLPRTLRRCHPLCTLYLYSHNLELSISRQSNTPASHSLPP